jgi:hypothetical protein
MLRTGTGSLISLALAAGTLVACVPDSRLYVEASGGHGGTNGGQGGASGGRGGTSGGQGGAGGAPRVPRNCVNGLSVLSSTSWNFPAELYGYQLLPQDLNAGSGGDFIAIYYKLGPDDGSQGACISRIYTINDSHGEANIPGGTRIGFDLNYTVGGDFIYLGFIQDASQPPIRSVVIYDQNYNKPTFSEGGGSQYQYTWVTKQNSANWQDLNEGAGGDLIFIGYSIQPE